MSTWPSIFDIALPLAVALPIVLTLVDDFLQARRRTKRWHQAANQLGLQAMGSSPNLAMLGTWRGIEVQLDHAVAHRYKQAPEITFVARAKLPSGILPNEIHAPADMKVVDGWLFYTKNGFGDSEMLRPLLDQLADLVVSQKP